LRLTEKQKLKALQKDKSPEDQYKLAAAVCALARCANGAPDSDANRAAPQRLNNDGQG